MSTRGWATATWRTLCVAPCALLVGCLSYTSSPVDLAFEVSPPGVQLSSVPPGASVLVDGRDSGFTTPCVIQLERDKLQRVEFALPGYTPATRVLAPNTRWILVPWKDGDTNGIYWRFPLWLPLGDFLVPVKHTGAHAPWRVHVRLRLAPAESEA